MTIAEEEIKRGKKRKRKKRNQTELMVNWVLVR